MHTTVAQHGIGHHFFFKLKIKFSGTLLKPNMVSGGSENLTKLTEMDIAAYTIRTLQVFLIIICTIIIICR